MRTSTHFSQKSIDFITKASKQKKPEWLEKNMEEYEEVLVNPMRELITLAAKELKSETPGYKFPMRSFVRLRRNAARDMGVAPFRNWVGVSISKDSESRYESLPNLYFELNAEDILSAGGLYGPSADQTKHIRKWIDQDPTLLLNLLKDRDFKKVYPSLGDERVLKTKPRDYPIDHPRIDMLKLSAWYVWRPFKKKEVFSKNFAELLISDWRQILRLNRVLDLYTTTWPKAKTAIPATEIRSQVENREQQWDF